MVNQETKNKLLKIFQQHPRKADFQKLKPEVDFVGVAKNYAEIIKPFYEFVVMKDSSLKMFETVLGKMQRIPRRLSKFLLISQKNTEDADQETKKDIEHARDDLHRAVRNRYEDICFLQNLMFVLISESEDAPETEKYLRPELPKKINLPEKKEDGE